MSCLFRPFFSVSSPLVLSFLSCPLQSWPFCSCNFFFYLFFDLILAILYFFQYFLFSCPLTSFPGLSNFLSYPEPCPVAPILLALPCPTVPFPAAVLSPFLFHFALVSFPDFTCCDLFVFCLLDDIRLFHEIPQRDCHVATFSHGGHLLAAAIKERRLSKAPFQISFE
jgi:hypothetical protein